MAPSLPLVTAWFTAARAHVDESSMLQMPIKNQAADEDECRCPGYYEDECTAEAAQGCVWSSQGSSNGPWCQCLGDAVPVPITPVTLPPLPVDPVTEPAVCPAGWVQMAEQGADIGGCGLQACSDRYSPATASEALCAEACDANDECNGFSYAPQNGDRNHESETVCTLYNSDTPTGSWTNSAGTFIQVFCGRAPPVYHLSATDMKCPNNHGDRLFRSTDLSIDECHLQCQDTETCAHFSYGLYNGGSVCMGCTTLANQEVHVGFNTYDMEHSTPPVQMIENWDFEGMTSEGIDVTLGVNKWIHFLNNGNSGLTNTAIKDWQQMGSGAGASGLFSPGGNDIAEGSHVLFLNSGDDNNYVYQNLLQPFTATLNIEAAVGGGNGGNDGGYRMGLYAEDGSLVQEVAAGVNGAPDTSGSQYIITHMSVSVADHPAVVGQHLQLRLMKNKGAQGHYHYIRFT